MEDNFRKFDSITGEELPESVEIQKTISDEEVVAESEQLQQMQCTHGWKIVAEFLQSNIAYHQQALLTCDSINEMHRAQEIVKSYVNILSWIEAKHQQAKTILEEKVS